MNISKINVQKKNRFLLLIPCGKGVTGFKYKEWNLNCLLFIDAVKRVNYALSLNKNNHLVAILWHQGEEDVNYSDYQHELDMMIKGFRKYIYYNDAENKPFILGGMVPYWVSQDEGRIKQQEIIKDTQNRLKNIGYADP